MPGTFLGFPFNPELFSYLWETEQDQTLLAILNSGAMVADSKIQNLIANGSDLYTVPFYKTIGGTPENYDGETDITLTAPTGGSMSGIVYGRAHGWKEEDFVADYNSKADPMHQITSQVGKYWQKNRQSIMLKILSAIFGITGAGDFANWSLHTTDLSSASLTVADPNKLGATSVGDAVVKALGDAGADIRLALMHSTVANSLAGIGLLNYRKYTDIAGIERQLNIADINGKTVIVDDSCPLTAATGTVAAKYTTYLLGNGVLRYATAPVKNPVEMTRDAVTDGGYTGIITRLRETIHPNGFSFTKPASGYTSSPTDAQLALSGNWSGVAAPKAIAAARIISNG